MSGWGLAVACVIAGGVVCASRCEAQGPRGEGNESALRKAFDRGKHSDAMRKCWEESYKSSGGGKSHRQGIPYYPTEQGIIFLSAWLCTGQEKFRQAAVAQFEFAHSRENEDGLLITEQGFNRDTQARQIYNFYAAYKILGDVRYLTWAGKCAEALIDHLPRKPHLVLNTSKTFTLFVAGYCRPDKPYDTSGLKPWVDVNQNAELALAYTLLYHEPRSAFHKSAVAKEIVVNEMEAGLTIQDTKTGAIPIGDSDYWITRFDTSYGAYALFSWTWLNTYWKNPEWQKHIDSAGRWLAGFSTGKGKMEARFYPRESDTLGADLWWRIPAFLKTNFSPDRLIDCAYGALNQSKSSEEWAYAPLAYFELMRIPPEFYLSAGR